MPMTCRPIGAAICNQEGEQQGVNNAFARFSPSAFPVDDHRPVASGFFPHPPGVIRYPPFRGGYSLCVDLWDWRLVRPEFFAVRRTANEPVCAAVSARIVALAWASLVLARAADAQCFRHAVYGGG